MVSMTPNGCLTTVDRPRNPMVFCTLDILRADIWLDFTLAQTSIPTQPIAPLSIASEMLDKGLETDENPSVL